MWAELKTWSIPGPLLHPSEFDAQETFTVIINVENIFRILLWTESSTAFIWNRNVCNNVKVFTDTLDQLITLFFDYTIFGYIIYDIFVICKFPNN